MTIPDADGVIHGCRDPRSGALSVIDSDTQQCPRGATALNWNQTGPQGPQGPVGPQGPAGMNHGQFVCLTNIDWALGRHPVWDYKGNIVGYDADQIAITVPGADPHANDPGANFVGVVTLMVRNTGTTVRQLVCGVQLDKPQVIVTIAPGDVATVTVPLVNRTNCCDPDPNTNDPVALHVIALTLTTIQVTDVYAQVSR